MSQVIRTLTFHNPGKVFERHSSCALPLVHHVQLRYKQEIGSEGFTVHQSMRAGCFAVNEGRADSQGFCSNRSRARRMYSGIVRNRNHWLLFKLSVWINSTTPCARQCPDRSSHWTKKLFPCPQGWKPSLLHDGQSLLMEKESGFPISFTALRNSCLQTSACWQWHDQPTSPRVPGKHGVMRILDS
ncbi:hypothetical protein BKA82DRAFT_327042 [Pisolithus tinctorius]|uniref:Uncharacterized protein n=1 Tax=Pisolithus tinctorius Marx 270 TaxID=870435 RepID=A0A0C3PKN7_PISTI|nr:hypothetical protein BKA82DRAFT_327042 [Pisolithus tinctorius]KIO08809.1 hypothetical protein M404DRAFT_327042 [Pisolithus tinctorius Marx 270]